MARAFRCGSGDPSTSLGGNFWEVYLIDKKRCLNPSGINFYFKTWAARLQVPGRTLGKKIWNPKCIFLKPGCPGATPRAPFRASWWIHKSPQLCAKTLQGMLLYIDKTISCCVSVVWRIIPMPLEFATVVRRPPGVLKKKSAPRILLEKEGRKSKLHQVFHSKTSAAIGQLAK